MKTFAIIALVAFTVTPAFAQSEAEKSGVNSLIGAAPKTVDFVQEAATSDMFEIGLRKLAIEKGDATTQAFVLQMVMGHSCVGIG